MYALSISNRMKLTCNYYKYITRALMALSHNRVVCVLEGGYKPTLLANDVCSVIEALLGMTDKEQNPDDYLGVVMATDPKPSTIATLRQVVACYSPHYKCLKAIKQIYS